MAKQSKAAQVAQERIEELYTHAQRELAKHPEDSRVAIKHLRRMAEKHNLVIKEKKRTFCLNCNTLLVPGTTCTVRIHDNRRVITCSNCNTIKRLGLK